MRKPKYATVDDLLAARTTPSPTGCLIWTGATVKGGYGWLGWRGVQWQAHRFVWTHKRGPIPPGLVIDHLCRTPACVNVDHMEVVTRKENTLRGTSFAAINAQKTECAKGHPYDAENTRWPPPEPGQQRRECRRCRNAARVARARRARARVRAGSRVSPI